MTQINPSAAPAPPPSAVSNGINTIGFVMALAVFMVFRSNYITGIMPVICILIAYAFPILLLEAIVLRTPWRESTGLDFRRRGVNFSRIGVKLLGLYGSWGFVAVLYWLFPEYHGSFYEPVWRAVEAVIWGVILLSFPYVFYMDRWMKQPEDSYYWWGRCLLGKFHNVPRRVISQHMLGWVVKGFFLPLMFVYFSGNIANLLHADVALSSDISKLFRLAMDTMFTVDLMAAVAGYALALKLFDTHFRSAEPTLLGWAVCLVCYQPFQSVFMRFYLPDVGGEFAWVNWLAAYPALQMMWGATAIVLLFLYVVASVNFGCRFSNLTHRGVLTNGLYRFTKHPAYVSKNLFWWITSVPFALSSDPWECLRSSVLLAGASGIYYLRARTEENHLSHDPVYVEYALWMNEHGMFSRLAKRLPFLRYTAPANWQRLPKPYDGIK